MVLKSPAKLNLGLSIVGRDAKQYHLIESLFWPIDLCDSIEIEESDRFDLEMSGESNLGKFPGSSENLVSRACEKAGLGTWKIRVEKRIPLGAGLGGGSSNAGTVLRVLAPKSPPATWATLGADVPFFLNPRPSWVTGTGEKIAPLKCEGLEGLSFLLVLPDFHIPTERIFAAYRQLPSAFSASQRPFENGLLTGDNLKLYLSQARNDLEPAIVSEYPAIANILQTLRELPSLYAGVSGTGSTCFAVFEKKIDKEFLDTCRWESCRSVLVNSYSDE
ncbi:MAG: hypothetical protein R3B54_09040 [Bdellovibrionota bacterium]